VSAGSSPEHGSSKPASNLTPQVSLCPALCTSCKMLGLLLQFTAGLSYFQFSHDLTAMLKRIYQNLTIEKDQHSSNKIKVKNSSDISTENKIVLCSCQKYTLIEIKISKTLNMYMRALSLVGE
jgi:hypothetical protein